MKRNGVMAMLLLAVLPLSAQSSFEEALAVIEQNNTTLRALRQEGAAQKADNRVGGALPDPEVGFNYLWGNPSVIGKRQDISVSQEFDAATVSGAKQRLAAAKDKSVDWQYAADRKALLLEAENYLCDLLYWNGLLQELAVRKQHAQTLVDAQKHRMDKGEGNRLDYNSVVLSNAQVAGTLRQAETERQLVIAQLTRLNGGKPLASWSLQAPGVQMPASFEQWYAEVAAQSPMLAFAKSELAVSQRQLSLAKTQALPSISLGYMSEKTLGERYQGVTVGVSIPLWSGRRQIRQSKAAVVAAEARNEDALVRYQAEAKAQYERVLALRQVADTYRQALGDMENTRLLKKAFDAGAISLIDYTVGAAQYYEAVDKALEAERDYRKAWAALKAM